MTDTFEWPNEPPIILVGPTAVGKTAAAIALAVLIGGEIISADSMQVYRGMDIGTAKPGAEERNRVRFHLLDVTTPDQQFTVSDWKVRAESAITDIVARGQRPIVCGGTGLYVRALLDNWTLAETPADENLRAELRLEVTRFGAAKLHERLHRVDPTTAARVHPNDAVRIVRYRKAAMLLKKWAQDDPAYDQNTGDALELELAKDGMRCEDRDEANA